VFWLLGLKTEQNRIKVWTKGGGMTEVFAYILANRSANPLPMFITEDSAFSLTVAESVGRNAPFEIIVRETRGPETKDLKGGRSGCSIPLYIGYPESLKVPREAAAAGAPAAAVSGRSMTRLFVTTATPLGLAAS
jgi:hypothetical protein